MFSRLGSSTSARARRNASVAHVRDTLRVYPLADAGNPPKTNFLDATGRKWDTLPYYDVTYFQDLNAVVQSEPVRERDKSMYGLLRAIGIEKGKPNVPLDQANWVFRSRMAAFRSSMPESMPTSGRRISRWFFAAAAFT